MNYPEIKEAVSKFLETGLNLYKTIASLKPTLHVLEKTTFGSVNGFIIKKKSPLDSAARGL